MTHLVHVNHHSYEVDTDRVDGIENLVLAAVQAGGTFIDIPLSNGHSARVLVTPASGVRIQGAPRPIATSPQQDHAFDNLAFYDASGTSSHTSD